MEGPPELSPTALFVDKYGYSLTEKGIMVIITAITNFSVVPVFLIMIKRKRYFQAFIGYFTMYFSFMYHFLEALQVNSLFLTENEYHRLDNIGAIVCFIILIIYLADLQNFQHEQMMNYIGFFMAILLQEAEPWNLNFTIYPILSAIIICVLYKTFYEKKFPKLRQKKYFLKGCSYLAIAIFFFYKGLDEYKDYLRIYHGLWHMSVGFFGFYIWQAKSKKQHLFTFYDAFTKTTRETDYDKEENFIMK